MTKINELKLDDIKAVVGGARYAAATASASMARPAASFNSVSATRPSSLTQFTLPPR